MKRLLLFLFLFFIGINPVLASTNTASSYVLMDQNTGRILTGKNYNNPMLIASITKIMTAIIAIESNRLDEVVTVDESVLKSYGSGIYIQVGEEITLRDLVYGLMLRSGNDAALMIANFVMGSEEEFVEKMNDKAKELGMKNTTFVNSSGLDNTDSGNYSTAYDMALVTSYAMKNKDYRQIVSTKKHTVKTNYKTYIWYNKNKLLQYEYITGGKTGYTEKAKRTLVSTANIDKMNLVVVTLKDSDDWNTHLQLYEYADNNYISYKVLDKSNFSYKNDLYKDIYIKEDVYIPLTKEETDNVTSNIKLYKLKKYDKNTIVGKNEILVNDKLITSINIYAKPEKKIEEKSFIKRIMDFFK